MTGLFTIIIIFVAAMLAVAYARKMQQGGFTKLELQQMKTRGWAGGILLAVVVLLASSIVVIPVGQRLVVYNLFTHQFSKPLAAGYRLVMPGVYERQMYNIKTQEYTMSGIVEEGQIARSDSIQVLSSDGLKMDLDITVLYHLDPEGLNELHASVGRDYENIIIRPTLREAIRNEFAQYEATEAYSASREVIQNNLVDRLRLALGQYNVILDEKGVKLRNIALPPTVVNAIEEKKAAQQQAEQMVYVLDKERQEKERIKIEAEAQAERIQIVNDALASNPNYLNWLAIDKLNENIDLVISDGKTILNLDAMRSNH
ncbi:prohibitin family protein [bacterium]|nr:prohibitin family protein [bacterium]